MLGGQRNGARMPTDHHEVCRGGGGAAGPQRGKEFVDISEDLSPNSWQIGAEYPSWYLEGDHFRNSLQAGVKLVEESGGEGFFMR